MYSLKRAAKFLGIDEPALRRLVDDGKITYVQYEAQGPYLFTEQVLKEFRAQATKPAKEDQGKAIKARRVKLKLTQKDLADRVGIAQSHLSRIERGIHRPNDSTAMRIAEVLGTDLERRRPTG